MSDIDRRTATLLAIFGPILATAAAARVPAASPSHADKPKARSGSAHPDVIAMLVYPKMTALDLVGPHHMFSGLTGANVHLVAKSLDPVTSDTGLTITPTTTFADCPRDVTVLFTPGGSSGTLAAAADPETRAFMADRGARAKYVTSVCTGSLILGAAGLLKGYRATSHWVARDLLADFGAIPTDQRVVRDRNRVTGAGVTSGLDFGLTMVGELRDQFYAECIQLVAEYDPHPPYNSGSVHTAPAKVRESIRPLFDGFRAHARDLARELKA